MKKLSCALFLFTLCATLLAQTTRLGYYITRDGKRYDGVTIVNPEAADAYERVRIAYAGMNDNFDKFFYPQDIAAYGFESGYKYISANIFTDEGKEKNVFLKELIRDGGIILYKHIDRKGEHFLTIDRTTANYVPIADGGKQFRNELREKAAGCDHLAELDKLPLQMKESSLLSLYEAYSNCSRNNYPGVKFGVTINVGYSFLNFDDDDRFKIYDRPYAMPGFFVEIPLDRRISLRPEIYYFFTKTKSKEYFGGISAYGFSYKRHSLVIPIMLKYRFSNVKGRNIPYIEIGPTLDFRLSGKTNTVEDLSGGKGNQTVRSVHDAVCLVGPEIGFGMERRLKHDRRLYMGIRGGMYFGAAATDKKENRSNVSLNIGLGF